MEAVLLPPPLPAGVALLIVAGVAMAGLRIGRLAPADHDRPLDLAAGFVIASAALCAFVHAIAWSGIAHLWLVLRVLGWSLAAVGLIGIGRLLRSMRADAPRLIEWYRGSDWLTRLSAGLIGLCSFAYLAGALGPATDADSLDYHLGVPLDWLLHGGAYARPDWLHARLIGLGEMVNIVGLASGTDCLGALFQFAGLLVTAVAVASLATTERDRMLGWLLVVGAPVMMSLVFAQKPLMLPVGATTLAMVILVRRWETLDTWSMCVVFGAVAFAISCKYTFMLSGGVILALGMMAEQRSGRLPGAIAIATVALLLLPGPVWTRNFCFYHDPLSPFLERFRANPDPDVTGFAAFLRVCCEERGAARFLFLPARLIGIVPVGELSTVLGIGTLAFVAALGRGGNRILLGAAVVVTVLVLAMSELKPRFFLEPYLWCAAAAVAAHQGRFKALLHAALVLQCALVAMLAAYGAAVLIPAGFSRAARARVMSKVASGYDEARWLNAVLPPSSTLVTTLRSHALLERPFVVGDDARALTQVLARGGAQFAVVPFPFEAEQKAALAKCLGPRFSGPREFRTATRNPFNSGVPYELQVFRLNTNRDGCGEMKGPAADTTRFPDEQHTN